MNKTARPRLRLPGFLRYRLIRLRLFRRRWQIRLERAFEPLERRLGDARVRVVEVDLPADETGPRLIVPVSNPQSAPRLARIAAAIAATRGGSVILLYVERPGSEDETDEEGGPVVEGIARWPVLAGAGEVVRAAGQPLGHIVMRAADVGQAIRRAAQEVRAEVIVLGWRGRADDKGPSHARIPAALRSVLEYPPADVMIVGGQGENPPSKVLVPMVQGRDNDLALGLARGLAAGTQHVTALKVLPDEARMGDLEAAARRLREDLKAYGEVETGQLVLRAASRADGILACIGRGYDGVVMAAPNEPLLERLFFGQNQMKVAASSAVPVIVVKRRASTLVYLGRRIWRLAYDRLPKLSQDEQAEVEAEIGRSASPRADFFVMIALSSGIAGFGLLQNSPAVIIGAMLVAPLMSAIVGVGLGVVEGDLGLIRRAGTAALRGAILAVLVGAALGLLRAGMIEIPSEIMARARPNLLDLGVALTSGAAGAYALSRKDVSASLAGVAIAAALVPPLVSAGIGFSLARMDVFFGALLLFSTNFVAIAAASGMMMILLGFGPSVDEEEERRVLQRGIQAVVVLLAVLTLSLGFLTWQTLRLAGDARLEQEVEQVVLAQVAEWSWAEFGSLDAAKAPTEADGPVHVELTLKMPAAVAAEHEYEAARDLRNRLTEVLDRPVELYLSVIPTRRIGPRSMTPEASASPSASVVATGTPKP
jgi:uncharacterized hydrophobic protein (TIGR00271 family)